MIYPGRLFPYITLTSEFQRSSYIWAFGIIHLSIEVAMNYFMCTSCIFSLFFTKPFGILPFNTKAYYLLEIGLWKIRSAWFHSASPDYCLPESDLSLEISDSIYPSPVQRTASLYFITWLLFLFSASFSTQSIVIYMCRQVLIHLTVLGTLVNKKPRARQCLPKHLRRQPLYFGIINNLNHSNFDLEGTQRPSPKIPSVQR